MKILIKKTAASDYARQFRGSRIPNWDWYNKLKAVEGKTLEVETKHLFKDQFNTPPIPGVSELGLRIMEDSVERVIDDERPGKVRCNWCGANCSADELECPNCRNSGYLEPF